MKRVDNGFMKLCIKIIGYGAAGLAAGTVLYGTKKLTEKPKYIEADDDFYVELDEEGG